jgi:RNA polymerase sigma-70 factor (ECF subfamily)
VGNTDWQALELLYEGLVRIAPGIGAVVGRSIAVGQVRGPEAGLVALDLIDPEVRDAYQPYWAARAWLLSGTSKKADAVDAYRRAAALADSKAVSAYLEDRVAELETALARTRPD